MGAFWVITPLINDRGRNVGYPFEIDGCDDVTAFADRIANAGIVAGNRLDVEDDGTRSGNKILRKRIPTALTAKGIAAVTPLTWRLIKE